MIQSYHQRDEKLNNFHNLHKLHKFHKFHKFRNCIKPYISGVYVLRRVQKYIGLTFLA